MQFALLSHRREAARLAQADAEKLIRLNGERALDEARRRERAVLVKGQAERDPRTAAHWRKVAQIIVERTAEEQGLRLGMRGLF